MNNMETHKKLCPITGEELIYIGHEENCYDGPSYYSPVSNNSIVYSVWPRRRDIYSLVDSMNASAKESRYFKLNEDQTWTEMKRVPYGDHLFPKNYFGSEWKKACIEAEVRNQKRLEKEKYWNEHPEEDPIIRAKTVGLNEVKVSPMGPPTGNLYYIENKN